MAVFNETSKFLATARHAKRISDLLLFVGDAPWAVSPDGKRRLLAGVEEGEPSAIFPMHIAMRFLVVRNMEVKSERKRFSAGKWSLTRIIP
jgi:hypothetical protein